MNTIMQKQVKLDQGLSFTHVQTGLLQRKCDRDECEESRKKRLTLQRTSTGVTGHAAIPSIVHEVLTSPGEPLDHGTRAFMEPRFGHDFSRVRIHKDPNASASARTINAIAYTVGHHIVLPGSVGSAGVGDGQLLAHDSI